MYELIQAGTHTYYIDCPAKMGIYEFGGGHVCLIDSGSDKDAGRKIRQILDAHQWTLSAIVNTHSNADHIGGNHYLQGQTHCAVFANGIEADFTRHPLLEPSFLYGGYPYAALRHKFLMAQESDVRDFSDPSFPKELQVIPLPGHFFDMTGFRTPDDVVFLADCIASRATLEKYAVPFIYDVAAYLKTLDAVSSLHATLFVPAHDAASADVSDAVQCNRTCIAEIVQKISALCRVPLTFEQILQQLFTSYSLTMTAEQYVLVGSTVRSFLSYLNDSGTLTYSFENNRMVWRTVC